MNDAGPSGDRVPGKLFWTRRVSLTARILTFNIIALALMAGSLFYLDSLRKQLAGVEQILALSGQILVATRDLFVLGDRGEVQGAGGHRDLLEAVDHAPDGAEDRPAEGVAVEHEDERRHRAGELYRPRR